MTVEEKIKEIKAESQNYIAERDPSNPGYALEHFGEFIIAKLAQIELKLEKNNE